jgi:hypothetical protein
MAVSAPASRNALCPCGSGRRYKDCHGSLAPRPEGAAAGKTGRLAALLQEALALQRAGDVAQAIARYEAALAEDPGNFDALHMLGVAYYQLHALDTAARILRKALAVQPQVAAAQQNLDLVVCAQTLEREEDALCRAVLPRLAPLCAVSDDFAGVVAAREPVDVLLAARDAPAADPVLKRIADGALGPARLHALPARTSRLPATRLEAPIVMLYGADESLATWGHVADLAARVLVVTRDAPSRVHDRLGELSDYGRHRVHVRFHADALKRTIRLPGDVLFEPDVAPVMARRR